MPLRRGTDASVESNARLTAMVAVVLLVLLAVEGVTVLRIGQLLTVHVVVGMLLVPPVLVKMTTTGWRFFRYYSRDPAYRRKGPPHPVLRVLGPMVVVLTVLLFGSGIALFVGPASWHSRLLLVHKASFIVWLAVTAIHVVGHLRDTARLAPLDWTKAKLQGRVGRYSIILAALAVGVVLAVVVNGDMHHYLNHGGFHQRQGLGKP